MSHSNSEYKTEFKHDTDNFVIFTVVVFSVAFVMFVIAICLIVFRLGRESEYHEKVTSKKSLRFENMRTYENKMLTRSDREETAESVVIYTPIEQAMKNVVRNYNR